LFLDAVDRMHWSHFFTLTPGKLRTVYLEEISPEGYGPNDVELLKQKVYQLMEERILYYQPSWVKIVK
jgi:1-acyl-sn-glycerol-3-phosphate acyltransferase